MKTTKRRALLLGAVCTVTGALSSVPTTASSRRIAAIFSTESLFMSAMERESPGVNDNKSAVCPELVYRAMVPAQSIQSSTCAPTKTTFSFRLSSDPGRASAGTAALPVCCARPMSGNAPVPAGFHLQGKGFNREKGWVLYVQDVFKPNAP